MKIFKNKIILAFLLFFFITNCNQNKEKSVKENVNIVFDFDSTLAKSETFQDILSVATNGDEDKINKIKEITNLGMNGEITMKQSFERRLQVASIDKSLIQKEISKIELTEGMPELVANLQKIENVNVYILSGGMREMIIPIAKKINIKENNVFGNDLEYKNDVVVGVKDSVQLQEKGKAKLIQQLKKDGILKGKIIVIGDGMTDLETGLEGVADNFICFAGVVERQKVVDKAKENGYKIAKSANELYAIILDMIK